MGAIAEGHADNEVQSVADAMRDAAVCVADHAAEVKETLSEGGPRALRAMSRFVYTSSYVISYGVVYAAVFVAHSLPQDNAVMHGLRDGGRAAMDALKSK